MSEALVSVKGLGKTFTSGSAFGLFGSRRSVRALSDIDLDLNRARRSG